ncbi:hypothetical protein EGR_11304 [Echinococcus granulosus]|uniref:Uncharacterized protein n=1 Tax=Echinococcus granulosus TaxID=6210 RepID=W6TYH6_ECHGR|nr:hypothetical protein EGR_11304 [Echinococcus granulosus]EUB53845.1 hypothetical protein EGR_11304 [Echinococcus granulosus]
MEFGSCPSSYALKLATVGESKHSSQRESVCMAVRGGAAMWTTVCLAVCSGASLREAVCLAVCSSAAKWPVVGMAVSVVEENHDCFYVCTVVCEEVSTFLEIGGAG